MDLSHYLNPETIATLQTGGYIIMFLLMVVEWPLVTFAGAFLASLWVFDIYIVFMLGWIGDILGDLLFYSIGRYGLNLFKVTTTIDTEQEFSFTKKLDWLIQTNLLYAIILSKVTPYMAPIGLMLIGKSSVSIRKFLIYALFLCIPTPLLFWLAWYYLAELRILFSPL